MALISSLMAVSIAKSSQLGMSSTSSNTIAMQANQYAETEAEILRHTNYNDLSSKGKTTIASTSYTKQIVVGVESVYDSTKNIKQKQCVVSIYKDSEVLPRSTLTVTRLSKGDSDFTSVPQGTILPWYGNLSNIPSGFALCNGQNGTPDLRNRFLVGAGDTYNLGTTGGADWVTLTYDQMPRHAHNRGTMEIKGNFGGTDVQSGYWGNGAFKVDAWGHYNDYGGDFHSNYGKRMSFVASRSWTGVTSYEGGNQAHENRPPYYALYYIMKL